MLKVCEQWQYFKTFSPGKARALGNPCRSLRGSDAGGSTARRVQGRSGVGCRSNTQRTLDSFYLLTRVLVLQYHNGEAAQMPTGACYPRQHHSVSQDLPSRQRTTALRGSLSELPGAVLTSTIQKLSAYSRTKTTPVNK